MNRGAGIDSGAARSGSAGSEGGQAAADELLPRPRRLIPASFQDGYFWIDWLQPVGIHAPGVAGAMWRARERSLQGEFCLLDRLAKPLNFQIGSCNVDGHQCDLNQHFSIEPQTCQLVGSQRNNGTCNPMRGQCHTKGLARCRGFCCAHDGRFNVCGIKA